jgi:integrase
MLDLEDGTRDVLWRRAVAAAEIPDLHFHDSRAEAIWHLSEKSDVMELARMIGHRDIRSLTSYYNAGPDELADLL